MEKIFRWSVGLLVFALVASSVPFVEAATLTFDNNNVTLALPNGHNIDMITGSTAESVTVNADSTLTVELGTDSDITFQSQEKLVFSASPAVAQNDCSNYVSSLHLISTSAQTITVTLSATETCAVGGGGGNTGGGGGSSGGGGGGAVPQPPTSTSVSINGSNAKTVNGVVTLALAATNATQMLIANSADFTDATSWKDYSTSAAWSLSPGVGTKTVYVKFRSSSGAESTAVSDTIELISAPSPANETVNVVTGGSVQLADKSVGVTVPPWATPSTAVITITPKDTYGALPGTSKIVGDLAYDLLAKIGDTIVSQFTQPLTLTFTYSDEAINGLKEATLTIQYWDDATGKWVSIGGTVDVNKNTITATTNHFTLFAVVGEPASLTPIGSSGAGSLIKLQCAAKASVNDPCKAVYYLAANGKRYVFPNEKTYKTWYADFGNVSVVTADEMSSHLIGGNVTYRPGVKLVKITTDPKVYAVAAGGTLRWLASEAVVQALYGTSWAQQVEDVSDAFFVNYTMGADINAVADYSPVTQQTNSPNINTDKGL